jgi:beta-mannosidase
VADASAANFNCLRIWGGGVYPSDDFYDLCDRYGLVVWQDLMFACAVYDLRDARFKAEIAAEVKDNLLRLRHHASLGLICGNNEMEWGFVEWDFVRTPASRTDYLEQYQILFPQIVAQVCPEVYYWPASPSSGGDFDQPNSPDRGDCHFWDVWHQNKDYTEYTKHNFRFMSEFGFESFPALKTIEGFTLPQDRNVHSPVMDDHQRCVGGNAKILNYAAKYFRAPKDFAQTIYLSQVSQSEAQRAGIEHWRRHRGQCMGSVYWQLNDNWPVASWSSIDSEGRWKLLHYTAKKAYAPALLSSTLKDVPSTTYQDRVGLSLPSSNGHYEVKPAFVEIHLSNEGWSALQGELEWTLVDFNATVLRSGKAPLSVGPWSSGRQAEVDLRDLVHGREVPRNCLLTYRATLVDGRILHGFQTFVPFKMLDLPKVTPTVRLTSDPSGNLAFEVSADKPALFVWLDHPDFDLVLSDNGLVLDGKTSRRVSVDQVRHKGKVLSPETGVDLARLTVGSLVDTY